MEPAEVALPARSPRLRLVLTLEVEHHRGADEILQGLLVDLLAFMDVDGAPDIPLEAGVEEPRRILQRGSFGEGHLDGLLVRLPGAHDAGVRPDRSPPLPLLDDLRISRADQRAHLRERLPAPVLESPDLLVDQRRRRFDRNGLFHGWLQLWGRI